MSLEFPFQIRLRKGLCSRRQISVPSRPAPRRAQSSSWQLLSATKPNIPLFLQSYMNPIYKYGIDAFFDRCKEVGVDGVILPDVPYEQKADVQPAAKRCGVSVISMIAPAGKERMQKIARDAEGFLYMLPSMCTMGDCCSMQRDFSKILESVRPVTNIPIFAGLDDVTSDKQRSRSYCRWNSSGQRRCSCGCCTRGQRCRFHYCICTIYQKIYGINKKKRTDDRCAFIPLGNLFITTRKA